MHRFEFVDAVTACASLASEETCARLVRALQAAARHDGPPAPELRAAIRGYAAELCDAGVPPERVLREIKELVRRAAPNEYRRAGGHEPDALMKLVVEACIRAYYRAD